MQRALLCGYYGMGNGGDEALLATLLQMLPPGVEPLVLSAQPQATEKLHGVPACDRWNPRALVGAMRRSDQFIWGGGSLLQDATSARNPIYYGGLMGLAQGLGLRTVAWAQGIGPLHRRWNRWIARQAFARCDRISVRDRASAQLLQSWNIDCAIAPDPVWALAASPAPALEELPSPRVAVVLRSHPQLTPVRLTNLTAALVQVQQATGGCVLLIPFQPRTDLAIAQKMLAALPQGAAQIAIETDPRALKGLFRGVDLAIAMRFHGLIAAAAEGCRCWALSYDPKVSRLMSDLSIPGWELSEIPDDAAAIAKQWLGHLQDGVPLDADRLHDLRDRALIHQQILIS